jgi:autoinducer 2-degrading protein
MYVTAVYVTVKPERIDDFVEACRLDNEGSRREPGNMRFDVLQMKDDPARFLLYEAYATAATTRRGGMRWPT